jgi:hypothetical protein
MLDAYLGWSERWMGKETPGFPDFGEEEKQEVYADYSLGWPIGIGLLVNQGWVADQDLQTTILQHCAEMCAMLKRLAEPSLEVGAIHDSYFGTTYAVGNLDSIPSLALFEAKLDQYPAGTVFTLARTHTGYPGLQRDIEGSLPAVLAKHGMKLADGVSPSR